MERFFVDLFVTIGVLSTMTALGRIGWAWLIMKVDQFEDESDG